MRGFLIFPPASPKATLGELEELFKLDKTLETVSSNNAALPPPGKNKGLVDCIRGVNRIFALTVVVPTTIAVVYFGVIASDVYVSESRFVVRSAQSQNQSGTLGSLLQGSALARGQDDVYPVIDYIKSRDALSELNRGNYILDEYGNHGDLLSHFPRQFDDSFEALWKYYGDSIVTVDFDATSSIVTLQVNAFTAGDAVKINELLLVMGERLINRMNERAAVDTVQFARSEVDLAAAKARESAAVLAAYRKANAVFDPDRQSALQLQQVNELEAQRFSNQTQLAQVLAIAPLSPQVSALKSSIAELEKLIKEVNGGVAGGNASLSQKAASYAKYQLDAQVAEKQLASAMATLESARAEAQRKQLYLERLVQPNKPDVAVKPHRWKNVLITFLGSLAVWGVLSLLLAGVREHHD